VLVQYCSPEPQGQNRAGGPNETDYLSAQNSLENSRSSAHQVTVPCAFIDV
jgi:hypothetical protein